MEITGPSVLHVIPLYTEVFIRITSDSVRRGKITQIVFDKEGMRYAIAGNYYKPSSLFMSAEGAFKD